jgi:hypothetical protein
MLSLLKTVLYFSVYAVIIMVMETAGVRLPAVDGL